MLNINTSSQSFSAQFFKTLIPALEQAPSKRHCKKHGDLDFILTGLTRVLNPSKSGRDFLQSIFSAPETSWKVSHFFATLQSTRRLKLLSEVNEYIRTLSSSPQEDLFSELKNFDLYAGDGHFLKGASHDERDRKGKRPSGHLFALNLRSGELHHLCAALQHVGRKREHDLHGLKRLSVQVLRKGAPKGQKVLYVWDRAGIDFQQWHRWKSNSGIYFLSREKENMKLEVNGTLPFDGTDPKNAGVIADQLMATSQGVGVRRIRYIDPITQIEYAFITSEYTLSPGLLVWLYRRRWDIEKVFDETKNRLDENKAWASSENAKNIQGKFIELAYNLLLLLHKRLENMDLMPKDLREEKRRGKRRKEELKKVHAQKSHPSLVLQQPSKRTQMGSRFIRWVRQALDRQLLYDEAVARLHPVFDYF